MAATEQQRLEATLVFAKNYLVVIPHPIKLLHSWPHR